MIIKKLDPKNIRIKRNDNTGKNIGKTNPKEIMSTDNSITELVFILDRSGSMAGLEKDTIGGFNSMIEKQKKEPGECYVTTILFDHEILVLHDRVRIADIEPMTDRDYSVRGCTALIDAIGTTVKRIEDIHRYQRPEDVPSSTIFVITTDGLENASKVYSADKVRGMIEEKKKLGWEFLFIGANIDAVGTAKGFGISADRAVNYHADSKGTGVLYEAVCEAVSGVRHKRPLSASWGAKISEDYESRNS